MLVQSIVSIQLRGLNPDCLQLITSCCVRCTRPDDVGFDQLGRRTRAVGRLSADQLAGRVMRLSEASLGVVRPDGEEK
jgi:hypothetical protein